MAYASPSSSSSVNVDLADVRRQPAVVAKLDDRDDPGHGLRDAPQVVARHRGVGESRGKLKQDSAQPVQSRSGAYDARNAANVSSGGGSRKCVSSLNALTSNMKSAGVCSAQFT